MSLRGEGFNVKRGKGIARKLYKDMNLKLYFEQGIVQPFHVLM